MAVRPKIVTAPVCPCGRPITRHQYVADSEEDYAARVESQRCRAKCRRLYPVAKPRSLPPLPSVSPKHGKAELRAVEKVKTARDRAYLQFILSGQCELRGGKWGACLGDLIYHHSETGGMGLKGSDYSAICACFGHHELFDNATKKGIGIFTEDELAAIIARNKAEYVAQGGTIKEGK